MLCTVVDRDEISRVVGQLKNNENTSIFYTPLYTHTTMLSTVDIIQQPVFCCARYISITFSNAIYIL